MFCRWKRAAPSMLSGTSRSEAIGIRSLPRRMPLVETCRDTAALEVLDDERIVGERSGREEHDVAAGLLAHGVDERIIGIQHRVAVASNDRGDHAFHVGQLFYRVNAAKAQVIGGDVEHDTHIALVEADSGPENAAARGLEHRDVDCRIGQDDVGGKWTRHVAFHDETVLDVHAVRRREAHAAARVAEQVCEQANGRCLSIRAGDGENRNRHLAARRVEHVEDWTADVSRLAFRGMLVHPNARRGVDLEDHRVVLAEGNGDVRGEHVDAGDVEADDAGSHLTRRDVVGMHLVGAIDRGSPRGQVCGAAEEDARSL
jgi:hypothetical protein